MSRRPGTVSAVIRLYDTLSRELVALRPRAPGTVSMYVCGPTVYDVPHLGHARTAVTYDVLYRYLTWQGIDVTVVSNITDVDDKIIERAAAEGSTEQEVATRFSDVYIRRARRPRRDGAERPAAGDRVRVGDGVLRGAPAGAGARPT